MQVDLNLPNSESREFAGVFQLLATACGISQETILSTWRRQSEFERKEITVTGLYIAFPVLTSFFRSNDAYTAQKDDKRHPWLN